MSNTFPDKTPTTLDRPIGQKWVEGSENITWDQICFVRSMNSPDQLGIDNLTGMPVALTTITGTKGESTRMTNHWTINHKVTSSEPDGERWGQWEGCPIIVISPGKATIEKNGLPQNLLAVDTFWTKDIVLPEGSIIAHVGPLPEQFSNIVGIKDVSLVIDPDKWQTQITLLNKLYNLDYNDPNFEETKTSWNSVANEVDQGINQQIDSIIKEMGYTPFSGANYISVRTEGADQAIWNLADQENIIEYGMHSDSILKPFDDFLRVMSYPKEKLFNASFGKKSSFQKAINKLNFGLAKAEKKKMNIDENMLYVSLAELYKTISHYDQDIKKESDEYTELMELFSRHSFVKDLFTDWDKNSNTNTLLKYT